jgi:hypothetical protein
LAAIDLVAPFRKWMARAPQAVQLILPSRRTAPIFVMPVRAAAAMGQRASLQGQSRRLGRQKSKVAHALCRFTADDLRDNGHCMPGFLLHHTLSFPLHAKA